MGLKCVTPKQAFVTCNNIWIAVFSSLEKITCPSYRVRKCFYVYAFILDGASRRMSWSWVSCNGLRQTWYDVSCWQWYWQVVINFQLWFLLLQCNVPYQPCVPLVRSMWIWSWAKVLCCVKSSHNCILLMCLIICSWIVFLFCIV